MWAGLALNIGGKTLIVAIGNAAVLLLVHAVLVVASAVAYYNYVQYTGCSAKGIVRNSTRLCGSHGPRTYKWMTYEWHG